MILGIHDGNLVGYEVNKNSNRLTLSIEPCLDPSLPFKVGFDGYAAHFFPAPLLPAILNGIYIVDAARLVTDEWAHVESGYRSCGWPGPWGASLDAAKSFVGSNKLIGYRLESSYGLSGWVLAKSVSRLGRKTA
jgi:hypothetical protein